MGELSVLSTFGFFGEIYITRVGSQFELQFGRTRNDLKAGTMGMNLHSNITDASLLFHVTPRTEYIFGGVPPNAVLALPEANKYASFDAEYNLLLVNGELWSLWDYSKRSDTDLLHTTTFNFHQPAFQNLWLKTTNLEDQNDYVLSFDGSSYLKPARFVDENRGLPGDITLYIRPVNVDGLILFLYDEKENSSIEVAMENGSISVLYNGGNKQTTKLEPKNYGSEKVTVRIRWRRDDDIILVSNRFIAMTGTTFDLGQFFNSGLSPTTTHAWMGGVKKSELKFPFVPKLTNESFRGCLGIDYGNNDLFTQSNIRDNYFSPDAIIKGVSGNCLMTVSELDVWNVLLLTACMHCQFSSRN